MKWDKYAAFAAEHPELGACLAWHIGPPGGLGNNVDTLKAWIEQRVRYIAVRPWESLDFNDPSYDWGWAQREYYIHFHVNNDDPRARRLKNTKALHETATLSELIADLRQWHDEWLSGWWVKQPSSHSLILDAVVEVRTTTESSELPEAMLDFYLPPPGYSM